jgi:carbamoyl-phosphate synthase small subunit
LKAYLILENEMVFEGERIGSTKDVIFEAVFNTSMTGYLEILTDPSYAGQGITMTYPLIGNYGVCMDDAESKIPHASAYIVRELADMAGGCRNDSSLADFLIKYDIPGIQGIDTRALTILIREKGVMNAMLASEPPRDMQEVLKRIRSYDMGDVVARVSCREPERFPNTGGRIALMDYGAKANIARNLVKRGFDVTVFPSSTPAGTILSGGFDGIMLSNGPGDPKVCVDVIANIRKMADGGACIFGICLGHQLLALALGGDTCKLKYGHRGGNQPVKDLRTGRVYMTSQNHGYMVMNESIPETLAEVSHININDGTNEGLIYKNGRIFSVQFHPEACPGPQESEYLFDRFARMMERGRADA